MGRTYRMVRLVRNLAQYGFVIIYALLTAQLLLTLLPGSPGRILSKMLEPATTALTRPFTGLTPGSPLLDDLNAVLPILIALPAYAALHFALRQLLRLMSRPRLARPSYSSRSALLQTVDSDSGTMQVARVRSSASHRYRMNP
jgi:hypothetical protein